MTAGLLLTVYRCPKPPFGFRWEIRRFTYGAVLERATRSYPTEVEARQVGLAALATIGPDA